MSREQLSPRVISRTPRPSVSRRRIHNRGVRSSSPHFSGRKLCRGLGGNFAKTSPYSVLHSRAGDDSHDDGNDDRQQQRALDATHSQTLSLTSVRERKGWWCFAGTACCQSRGGRSGASSWPCDGRSRSPSRWQRRNVRMDQAPLETCEFHSEQDWM